MEEAARQKANDEAFGRVADAIQAATLQVAASFSEALAPCGQSVSEKVARPQALHLAADVAAVAASGNGDLLEELVLDLLEESVRAQLLPRFWEFLPLPSSAATGESEKFRASWERHFHTGVQSLCAVYTAHTALLQELPTERTAQFVRRYATCFRIAFAETLPASVAKQAHCYLRWIWHRCSSAGRCRVNDFEEEWWWIPIAGEAPATAPAARVMMLLNPARRPPSSKIGMDPETWYEQMGDGSQAAQGEIDDGLLPAEMGQEDNNEDDDEDEDEAGRPVAFSGVAAQVLQASAEGLRNMGLGEVWRDLVMRFIVEELSSTVDERCRSEYDARGLLDQLTAWLYSPLLRFLRAAFGLPPCASRQLPVQFESSLEAETQWWVAARRVVLQFFETFVEVRIKEAFDMVRDFPDSMPALLDLRRCLARTGRTAPLVRALRQQLTRRLLIAGAHTRDVIKVYIKTIKAMRLVDPRGLLLEAVSAPIRAYLKRRKDTIRCIITALTEDSDLQFELHLGTEAVPGPSPNQSTGSGPSAPGRAPAAQPAQPAQTAAAVSSMGQGTAGEAVPGASGDSAAAPGNANANASRSTSQQARVAGPTAAAPEPPDFAFGGADLDVSENEEDPEAWSPDPIDADPVLPSRRRRAQDVISLLVGIYGSKEMFIKEYKEMLADRLLGNPSYSTEREMQNLELLKTRFGEAALAHCEVMLQDIKDSKRINGNVQQLAKAREPMAQVASMVPFRPPPRVNVTSAAGTTSTAARGLGGPFSLSSMFGLCLSSTGASGAQTSTSVTASNAEPTQPPPPPPAAPGSGLPEEQGLDSAGLEEEKLSLEQMHALVLSQHYWPTALAKADHPNFKLPASLEEALAEYSSVYTQTRARRSLQWKRLHGLVEITVQLADRAVPVVVSPVHYAVLACFTEGQEGSGGPRLTLQEVAAQVELPKAVVRKRLSFWVAKGVLREVSAGVFDVQESLSTMEASGGDHLDEDVEHSPGQSSARPGGSGGRDAASAAELKVCEAFVQVVLANGAVLPLGRIHNSLQMFMTDPQYTLSEAQLREFLSHLCQEGKLEFNGSSYTLTRRPESTHCATSLSSAVC